MTSGNAPTGKVPVVATTTGTSWFVTNPRGLGGLTRNRCSSWRALQWPYACTSPALASVRAATRMRDAVDKLVTAASGIDSFGKTFGALEFRNIRLGPPRAKGRIGRRKLPRSMSRFIRDVADTARVFVDHPIRPIKIEKHRAGGGMAAGSKADLDVLFAQEVVRTHDIVDAFHLMIDVLNTRPCRREQGHSMMHGIDPQKRRFTDPIADARVT